MWMLTSLFAPAAGFAGWADSPSKPIAACAAGTTRRESAAVKTTTAGPKARRERFLTLNLVT
jgi:hypothetical protein